MDKQTQQNDRKIRKPLALGKKFRLFETVVEYLIRSLSFLSMAAIVLIFVFVFKEASPIFFGAPSPDETASPIPAASENFSGADSIAQEVYDPLTEETSKEKLTPRAKKKENISFEDKGKVTQEVYDPLAEDAPLPKKKTDEHISFEDKGKVQQEVYDPLAEDKPASPVKENIADLKPVEDIAPEAPVILDSAALALQKIETDSLSAQEAENVGLRESAASFWTMITGTNWQPVSDVPKYGFVPLFIGTLKVTLIALLFGAPLAILAAIFTSSFAPKWAREIIKPVIELLAGFPSVVIGFFALIVLATFFQDMFGFTFRLNAFVGGIAMSLAIIPIIYTISEDALTAVPHQLRDASTALGATKWQTALKIVLPAAMPGVFAAVILGFGRAFGETMIALMATGNAAMTSADLLEPVRTFSATIGAEMAEVVFGEEHYNVLFLIGAMLFVFNFVMNALVEFYIRKRLIKRIQGK